VDESEAWFEKFRESVGQSLEQSVGDYIRERSSWREVRLGPGDLEVLRSPPWVERLESVPLAAFLIGLRRLEHVVKHASFWVNVQASWAWDHFEDALHLVPPKQLRVQHAIDLLAEDVDDLNDRAERSVMMTRLAVRAQLSDRVAQYLRLLGRCFVAGFFPECVVVCRSVLEHSVRETFTRNGKGQALDRYQTQ
jgi:hypothetical protein